MLNFKKMHGLGNDFVIIDARDQKVNLGAEQIKRICDRNFGVGCDLLTLLEPSKNADIFARFYNPDGTESGACGNATRCVADIIMSEIKQNTCAIETGRGVLTASRTAGNMITVDMGTPKLEWTDIPLAAPTNTVKLPLSRDPVAVNMGNPHCVMFVDDVEAIDIQAEGPSYENHVLFPERTNVEFVQLIDKNKIRQRTWERGAGVTLACGSGACATAVAAIRRNLTDRKVEVVLDGGSLFIEWREDDFHVLMTGPYAHVFDGQLKAL